jgi:arylsulfatase A-like enzyme
VVVVTADHGEEFGEHRGMGHGVTLFDEVLRVPLLIAGPGIRPATVVTAPVSLVDVAPTVLALLGLPPEPRFEGRSLVPWLRGDTVVPGDIVAELLWSEPGAIRSHERAFIRGSLKLLFGFGGRRALYDLVADAGEHTPLSSTDARATVLEEASRARDRDLATRVTAAAEHAPVDEEMRRRLRALGYAH